jgi:hypothetical protein
MTAQMFALHQHWGNIGKITDITSELAAAINKRPIGLYLVLNGEATTAHYIENSISTL